MVGYRRGMEDSPTARPARPRRPEPSTRRESPHRLLASRRAAAAFALTLFLTTTVQVLWNPLLATLDGVQDWGLRVPAALAVSFVIAGCVVQAAAFLVSDRAPHATLFVVVAVYLLLAAGLQVPTWLSPMYIVIAASLFLLATRSRTSHSVLWAIGVVVVWVGALYLSFVTSVMTPADAVTYIARELPAFAAPVAAGTALGAWSRRQLRRVELAREEAELATQEHDRRVSDAQRAERARIAQELHDVAGQHLAGLITLAEAAATLVATRPERALELVAAVKNEGRFAAASVTGALSDLRATGATPPQKTADLRRSRELAEYWSRIGVPVDLAVTGSLDDLPVVVSSTAYRVLQEALTNAAKHAAGAPVTVRIDVDAAVLGLIVENAAPDGRATPAADVGLGWGLEGMRDRALLLQGALVAGPTATNGWRVQLRIPLDDTRLPEGTP